MNCEFVLNRISLEYMLSYNQVNIKLFKVEQNNFNKKSVKYLYCEI